MKKKKEQKIFVIGVIHGFTPENEIQEVLESINPDQVFVEIEEKFLRNGKYKKFSFIKELTFSYDWAKKNNISAKGFDKWFNITKKGAPESELKEADEKQLKLFRKKSFSWKKANNEKMVKIYEEPHKKLMNEKNFEKRNKVMLENILKHIKPHGNIVIVTGAAHLKYFEKHLPNAILPFRNYK